MPITEQAMSTLQKDEDFPRILEAAVAIVVADRSVMVDEGELLRAIAEALDCPVPPLLPGWHLT